MRIIALTVAAATIGFAAGFATRHLTQPKPSKENNATVDTIMEQLSEVFQDGDVVSYNIIVTDIEIEDDLSEEEESTSDE